MLVPIAASFKRKLMSVVEREYSGFSEREVGGGWGVWAQVALRVCCLRLVHVDVVAGKGPSAVRGWFWVWEVVTVRGGCLSFSNAVHG